MECIVALGAFVVISLTIFFYMRLHTLEKKSREIDALKAEIAALWARFGAESPGMEAEKGAADKAVAPLALAPTPAPAPTPVAPPQRAAAGVETKAVPSPAPVQVTAAEGPSLLERLPDSPFLRWFMGSHVVVRVGIVILFIGVAFLLKFAADQGWFSIELRLASAGALGLGLVYAGWRLRARQRIYALTLQGGGLGIAYLTTFAAFRLYELLPPLLAFGLLVAIGMACGVLAVLNDAKALALPAIVGGFAAPLLVSTGEGSHITLFSYFTLVNAAILLIAWYKSWRELNLVGFLFTFVLATIWGREFYQPEFFSSVEPFLILFFLFYLAIGLLFALRQPPQLVGLVDGPIVFATPVIVMAWQALLVWEMPNALAWSATIMGLLYGVLFVVLGRASSNFATLRQSYLAIGTVLVTLAVPLAFDAQITSAIWALAGLGMLWAGLRQKRRFHLLWGGLVQVAAALFFASHWVAAPFDETNGAFAGSEWFGLFDSLVVGGFMIAVTAIITGYLTLQAARRNEYLLAAGDLHLISVGATLWGLLWWYGSAIYFIGTYIITDRQSLAPVALLFVLTAVVGEWLGGRFQWRAIRLTSLLLWAAIALLALIHATFIGPLLDGWGWLIWLAAVVVHYWMLYRLDHVRVLRIYHAIGLWLLAALAMLDLIMLDFNWQSNQLWDWLAMLLVPWLLVVLVSLFGKVVPWPTAKHYSYYMQVALAPLVFLLALWTLCANLLYDGDSTPFSYLLVLNPFSIAQLLIFGALALWLLQLQRIVAEPLSLRPLWIVGACLVFLWFNAEIARIVHQFWGVPYEASALLDSSLLQAIYSIIWTLLAMALMFSGTRMARRPLWLVGAGLLGLTVIKLLLLDLAAADTLARIVSFIVVGLLMLLIGYFSPIPPSAHSEEPAV